MSGECRPLRVLYVTHESNLTGASRSLLDLLGALDRKKVDPIVLVRRKGPLCKKLEEIDAPWIKVSYARSVRNEKGSIPVCLKRAIDTIACRKVMRLFEREHIDVVHCNSLLQSIGMEAALRAEIPYVVHMRDFVQEDHGLSFVNEARMKELVQKASAVIYISDCVKRKFSVWAPNASSVVLFDGLEVSRYRMRHGELLKSGRVHLLLAGRIAPGKGQLEALQALKILLDGGMDAHLTIIGGVGDNQYAEQLSQFICENNLREAADIKSFSDDLKAEYAHADIALVCSKREAMGRTAVEGMLAGCLVICSDGGALPELVEDGITGLVYRQGEASDLARKIADAVREPEKIQAIAAAGQRYAYERFDAEKYASRVVELYSEILNNALHPTDC